MLQQRLGRGQVHALGTVPVVTRPVAAAGAALRENLVRTLAPLIRQIRTDCCCRTEGPMVSVLIAAEVRLRSAQKRGQPPACWLASDDIMQAGFEHLSRRCAVQQAKTNATAGRAPARLWSVVF